MSNKEISGSLAEQFNRPQDIKGEIILKPYKDIDFFIIFGASFIISAYLFVILQITNPLIGIIYVISMFGTMIFGPACIFSFNTQLTYRTIAKLLITSTGIYLQDYKGKNAEKILFSKVWWIRFVYDMDYSGIDDPFVCMPVFVILELNNGDEFSIPMNFIIGADRKKLFQLLPVIKPKSVSQSR